MTDRYVVIGNPVAHSKSPAIHAAFARQVGHDLSYGMLFAELDAFEQTALRFGAEGGRGLNVTVPFKQRAYALVQRDETHLTPVFATTLGPYILRAVG